MSCCELKTRLTMGQKAWLEVTAQANNRSTNGQMRHVIEEAMKADPLKIVVAIYTFADDTPTAYNVYIGEDGEHIRETLDKREALQVARSKAKELGLGKNSVYSFKSRMEDAPDGGLIVYKTKLRRVNDCSSTAN